MTTHLWAVISSLFAIVAVAYLTKAIEDGKLPYISVQEIRITNAEEIAKICSVQKCVPRTFVEPLRLWR